MRKNVASQVIGAEMITAADGTAFTGSVTVYVTGDGGTQALGGTGSGICTHEGNGFHSYVPTQAETNYNHVGFTFVGTGAIPATLQVYPVSYDPTDSVHLGLTALPNAAANAAGGLLISAAGGQKVDESILSSLFPTGEVYVDAGGTASTDLPYGSPAYPTTTVANGKIIADANNLHAIHLEGSHTFTAAMEHYSFTACGHIDSTELINLNGQSVEHSMFRNGTVTGAMGNAVGVVNSARFYESAIYTMTNINAEFFECTFSGASSILDGGWACFVNCEFGCLGAATLTLQAPGTCKILNMRGTLTLAGMDGGTALVSAENGATLIVDSTCTAGTLTIAGDVSVTDNSGGTTVVIVKPVSNTVQVGGVAQTGNDNGADINAILADTNELQTDDLPTLIGSLNNISAAEVAIEIADALTSDIIADSYSVDGAQPTIAQAILEIRQMMMEKSISSTTMTVKKPDGATTAMTFTLDSDTTPTEITRAT